MWNIPTKVENSGATQAGKHRAAEYNNRANELETGVTHTGISLTSYPADVTATPDADETMLAQSMSRSASLGVAGTDSGSANTYVVSGIGSVVVPKALFTGMIVSFVPDNSNTGASTANVFGLGSKAVRTFDDAALIGGEIVAGRHTLWQYDATANSSAGAWLIVPWADPNVAKQEALYSIELQSAKSQSIPATTITTLTDYTVRSSNLGDATHSAGVITIGAATAGLWQCQVLFAAKSVTTPSSATQAYISKNDSTAGINSYVDTVAGTFASVSGMVRVAEGDTIRSKGYHNGAGTTNNEFTNGDGGIFYAYRISA